MKKYHPRHVKSGATQERFVEKYISEVFDCWFFVLDRENAEQAKRGKKSKIDSEREGERKSSVSEMEWKSVEVINEGEVEQREKKQKGRITCKEHKRNKLNVAAKMMTFYNVCSLLDSNSILTKNKYTKQYLWAESENR